MASNYTENYGLCQWEATDQVMRKEFNKDNIKIDETLKALTDRDADLERACLLYTSPSPRDRG